MCEEIYRTRYVSVDENLRPDANTRGQFFRPAPKRRKGIEIDSTLIAVQDERVLTVRKLQSVLAAIRIRTFAIGDRARCD